MNFFFPSAFYFMFFGAFSFLMPFLTLFYQSAGYNGAQIGLLTGIAPLITLVGGPFLTGLADSTRRHKLIMAATIVATVTAALFLPRASGFYGLFGLVVLFSFFGAPIISLADSATISMLGENKHGYGRIRLWGSVGWGLVAPLAGAVVQKFGLAWPFYGYAIGMGGTLLVAMTLHFPTQPSSTPFKAGIKSLLSSKEWMSFLLMVLLGGIGLATINSYLFVYMENLKFDKTLMGFALTISTLSEIPVMFFAGRFLKQFSPRHLLLTSLLIVAGRLLLYSGSNQAWQILLIQLVHGFTFPLIWVAGVSYADKVAPAGLAATAQGMFGSTLMGVGAALGGLLGGLLLQFFDPAKMYLITGVIVGAGALLFFLAQSKEIGKQSA
ncbi:MAG: major facilitator superfamily domain-containing protein 6 [Anaerolineales bacterium]|jgi:PPP family 3-phenylpropionic acid transporter|nr:major facilitator superfamily domain-containing protein 6 [Anaerolineales bacterium]